MAGPGVGWAVVLALVLALVLVLPVLLVLLVVLLSPLVLHCCATAVPLAAGCSQTRSSTTTQH